MLWSKPKGLRTLKAATKPSLKARWRILHRGHSPRHAVQGILPGTWEDLYLPPGNHSVNGENKHQPGVSGETGLGTADKAANLERCKSSYRQLPESDG